MNILDAIDDPKVFAPAFRNQDSWAAWRAFLAALFGLEMDEDQHRIFTECTARADRPGAPANEAWLVCGRRAGKSFTLALIATYKAKVSLVSAQASQEKCSVGAEIRRPPRCPNCQPAPARLFMEAVAAFGASLKEG